MAESEQDKRMDNEVSEIFSDFSKKKQQENEQKIEAEKKSDLFFKSRGVITLIGAVVSVILLFNLIGKILGENSPLRTPRPWAVGTRKDSDYKIDGCIFRQWRIRKAIDMYYAEYNKFPEGMDDLYESSFLKQKVVCPASNKEYIFEEIKKQKVFSCPEPAAHQADVEAVYCSVISSPPMIKRIDDQKDQQI